MTLTLGQGPLAADGRETVNYRLDGPSRQLFFDPFPRRIRALFGGEIVLDTVRGMLLHETNLLPQLYLPWDDIDDSRLTPTEHSTHCPFKGDASYWSLAVGEQTATNAIWSYPKPIETASWLDGYAAAYWDAMDAWYDEDEEVTGHLRDPYHRVDTRATGRRVRVTAGGEPVAESRRAVLLSETGLPNRYYLPPEDVRLELLEPSATHTVCPYKGTASYRTLRVGGQRIPDAAWYYPEPLDGVTAIRGHLCLLADGLDTDVE
jgi:uncharacterized protein (DUF427 family)